MLLIKHYLACQCSICMLDLHIVIVEIPSNRTMTSIDVMTKSMVNHNVVHDVLR